jgi:hypothetical protein
MTWVWVLVGLLLLCGLGGGVIVAAVLVPVFLQAKQAAIRTSCLVNLKQLSQSQLYYSSDADDKFPDASRWLDLTAPYTEYEKSLSCPAVAQSGGQYGYAFNAALSNKKASTVPTPSRAILLYETANLVRNAKGDPKKEAPTNRHTRGRTESYCDGSVKWIRQRRSRN